MYNTCEGKSDLLFCVKQVKVAPVHKDYHIQAKKALLLFDAKKNTLFMLMNVWKLS
jgi:hypothetical protein